MQGSRRASVAKVFGWSGVWLALACAVAALLAGLGHRFGWWDYRTGFTILRWSAWTGLAAAAIALLGLFAPGRARSAGIAGLLLGLAIFAVPYSYQQRRPEGPPMNDVTTDTANPPPFVAVLPLRMAVPNKGEYPGPKAAARQKEIHPDIAPATLALPPAEAFKRSVQAVESLGWEIVAAEPAQGRIEATATTLFFGFKDDIVIRVAASGDGSRVDVRSVSRIGRGDFGTNAKRVRAFLGKIAG